MTKKDYYRIRDEVYKSAGKDTFNFDLMMVRIISKAIEEEREACAKVCKKIVEESRGDWKDGAMECEEDIRARGLEIKAKLKEKNG